MDNWWLFPGCCCWCLRHQWRPQLLDRCNELATWQPAALRWFSAAANETKQRNGLISCCKPPIGAIVSNRALIGWRLTVQSALSLAPSNRFSFFFSFFSSFFSFSFSFSSDWLWYWWRLMINCGLGPNQCGGSPIHLVGWRVNESAIAITLGSSNSNRCESLAEIWNRNFVEDIRCRVLSSCFHPFSYFVARIHSIWTESFLLGCLTQLPDSNPRKYFTNCRSDLVYETRTLLKIMSSTSPVILNNKTSFSEVNSLN